MKTIMTSNGYGVIVDDNLYDFLNRWRWKYGRNRVYRNTWESGKRKTISMHRLIMDTPLGLECDHKNLNKLDNRRENLRNCTSTQNSWNKGISSRNRLGYKGVRKNGKRWAAKIITNGKAIHIGQFDSIEEAALAYDEFARELCGEYAHLNFP